MTTYLVRESRPCVGSDDGELVKEWTELTLDAAINAAYGEPDHTLIVKVLRCADSGEIQAVIMCVVLGLRRY